VVPKARRSRWICAFIDPSTGATESRPKRVPALISYKLGKTAYTKNPDDADRERVARIAALAIPKDLPTDRFPDCQMTRVGRMKTTNSTAIHFLFLPRAAQAMALMWSKASSYPEARTRAMLLFLVEQAIWGMSVLNRYKTLMHGRTESSNVNQYLSGVFYVPSHTSEVSPWYNLSNRLGRLAKVFAAYKTSNNFSMVTCGTTASLAIPDDSIDYIFTDPPFGENIYYSDLNFLVESWHGVKTDPGRKPSSTAFATKAFLNINT
jgi:hypothetical protein